MPHCGKTKWEGVRLFVDYRKLNSVTKVDAYFLPRMDNLLNEATPTSFMSTIDLQSGYHQVKFADVDQDKTAFVCPLGLTAIYVCPPTECPATFQRLIDKFRSGLKDVFALSYLDDIIVLSETFEKHLEDLEKVFERLAIFKLHANRDTCHFACDRVKYLGFWITKDGIEADQDKIPAIQKIPVPTNVKEVQSLLQTCSWFRRYAPNFADIARPLSSLTKKKVQWHWGPEQQESFETLKMRLMTPPILKKADGSKPFTIRTDASSYALGAVLLQGSAPDEHVIEYASRLMIPAERNYPPTEREALTVVWALEKFRGYVENQQIFLASDHQPLKGLLSIKSPSGRLARWTLKIQSFNLKIDYTPGKANVVADMLSRPSYTEVQPLMCAITVDMPSRKYSPESEEEAQLVVPAQERERILQEYHDAPTAGHYGVENTYKKISSRYYFQGMKKFISEYIKTCPECNRYKPTNQKLAGLLRTPAYAQRFETLAIDLFGPLPETPTGKKWIFIVEDTSTKWVELFALAEATAENCAKTLIEVLLRYGLPRRLISDNGPQFISAVMQLTCDLLEITQDLIPVYHPQANPSERKNRDLKPRLAILVGEEHSAWEDKLPLIRFAMNTSVCDTTGHTAACLPFGRQLRTSDDIRHDIRQVIDNDNFVPEITPYLKRFANSILDVKDRVEQKQDCQKENFDR
ncbi:hypothetical protein TNCV_3362531 [Trichonephila clavipes]|nr:hypothetical protein TNCV_3362531 [Trichonephila clavipes]